MPQTCQVVLPRFLFNFMLETVNSPDSDPYAAAAQEFRNQSRHFRRSRLGIFACICLGLLAKVLYQLGFVTLCRIVLTPTIFGFLFFLMMQLTSRSWLYSFRCPRCGQRDPWHPPWDGWPEATCKYCYLPVPPDYFKSNS